jgi:hypothetical protein
MVAAKSENGNLGASGVVDYTAPPPPPPPAPPHAGSSEKLGAPADAYTDASAASNSTLTPAQTTMHKKMLEHFQSESYTIPGIEDGELLEVEKFWLVRVIYIWSPFLGVLISNFVL